LFAGLVAEFQLSQGIVSGAGSGRGQVVFPAEHGRDVFGERVENDFVSQVLLVFSTVFFLEFILLETIKFCLLKVDDFSIQGLLTTLEIGI